MRFFSYWLISKLMTWASAYMPPRRTAVKGDTLEYNAAAFRVGTNDMLEDLLKKMPGMEVAEDGSVTVELPQCSRMK